MLPGVGALAAPKPPVVDSQVSSAASRLNQVRARVEQVSTALDQTAAQYEQANAHRIRIADELAASDLVVQEARTAVAAAIMLQDFLDGQPRARGPADVDDEGL